MFQLWVSVMIVPGQFPCNTGRRVVSRDLITWNFFMCVFRSMLTVYLVEIFNSAYGIEFALFSPRAYTNE